MKIVYFLVALVMLSLLSATASRAWFRPFGGASPAIASVWTSPTGSVITYATGSPMGAMP